MLTQEAIDGFRAKLGGQLIQPEDEGYDAARKVYNAMIDRRPRLIRGCPDVADVITAVILAATSRLPSPFEAAGTTPAVSECATTAW